MPINGGYRVRVTPLSRGQVASLPKKMERDENDWMTWLSIGLTIAEIGAMFIPGVGVGISTGIAAGFGAAQTVIEYEQTGTVSPTSIGLNVASLFLPGVIHGAGAVIKNSGFALNRAALKAGARAEKAIADAGRTAEEVANFSETVGVGLEKWVSSSKEASYFSRAESLADRFLAGDTVFKQFGITEAESLFTQLSTRGARGAAEALDEGIREANKDFDLSANIEREFIDKFGVIDAQELFSRVSRASSAAEREAIVTSFLTERLTTEEAWLFSEEIKMLGKHQFKQGVDDISKAAMKAAKREARIARREANKAVWREAGAAQRANMILRGIGSSKFNDRVVQIVQLMDPADAGRYIIERLYRRMVKYFKPLFRVLGSVNKIDTAFEKAGGTLVKSNVIVGYRVIGYNKKTPGHSDIMISFYPEMTRSKHPTSRNGKANKNFHGKPPVFVTASDAEITGLIDGGMKYYLRKWAITRGGTAASMNTLDGMGLALMLILPFMQTGMLRNILSLGSNVSKMSKRFAKSGLDGWGDDFIKSFRRAVVNRPGRFLARGVIAPLAGRFGRLTALIVSRESQRFIGVATTAANAAIEGKKPKNFYKTFQSQFRSAAGSYGNRIMRSGGRGSALITQKKYRRKINMVKRLPRAFGL